jgi:RNA polymerase sigma-70 factor (ECF subfamily)
MKVKWMIPEAEPVKELTPDVVRCAKCGDQHAFARLFHRYERPLRSFLYGMTGRRESIDDLVQETMSRAFRLISNLRDESKFSSWIFGIARNVALESSRRQSWNWKLAQVELDHQDVQTFCDPGMNPESNTIKSELYQAIGRGFGLLDDNSRTVLALRVFAEKKYSEIAEITGWSLPKVKVEIYRARLKMREIIAPHFGHK